MTRSNARQVGTAPYPIKSRVFLRYEALIREQGVRNLAAVIHVSHNTIYSWLGTAEFDDAIDCGSDKKEKRLSLVRYLDSLKADEQAGHDDFQGASRFRQKEQRNRLSRWMQHFYDIVEPANGPGRQRTIAQGTSDRVLPNSDAKQCPTARFIEDDILWLPHGDGCVLLLIKPEWCPTKLTELLEVDNPDHRQYERDRPKDVEEIWPDLVQTLKVRLGKRNTFDGFTYDLLSITMRDNLPVFTFCRGGFFGQINSGEGLLWETALSASKLNESNIKDGSGDWIRRIFLRDASTYLNRRARTRPFDFTNRHVGVGINTLTVLSYRAQPPIFLMHERGRHFHGGVNAEPSSEAVNMWHVIPAGAWQPYDEDDAYHSNEFKFSENVLREFCEEVLAKEQLMKSLYLDSPPSVLYSAKSDVKLAATRHLFDTGGVSHWYLGCGLDLLTLKLEMLTLLIVDGDRWRDEVALEMPRVNMEGKTHQYPFQQDELQTAMAQPAVCPAGAACLWFANEHYQEILAAAKKLVED